ncbi:urokinase plasminogen activator surface receptor-like [Pleurodeles waltl]|uniref:urokinase plasminogen activator surface receptor-like n=1 Tax=Pleurodeles waltl TaxID=8319 RepID=UPI003709C1FE
MKALLGTLLLFLPVAFSLKCVKCQGSARYCRMRKQTCAAYETTCISLAYLSNGSTTVDTVMKGCSTTALCNTTSALSIGASFIFMTATCCESNYCNFNSFSAAKVVSNELQCQSCTTSTGCDTPSSVICRETNNRCMDVATVVGNNGTLTGTYVKGCGSGDACGKYMAYDTGTTQQYSLIKCCNSDNCNDKKIAVTKPPYHNGIICWGCNESGKNECALENQSVVRCNGSLARCFQMFGGPNRQTLKKGCCTEELCSNIYPAVQGIPANTEIQCCAGNLCNKWANTYPCPEDYSACWRPWRSPGLLVAALCISILSRLL